MDPGEKDDLPEVFDGEGGFVYCAVYAALWCGRRLQRPGGKAHTAAIACVKRGAGGGIGPSR